MNFKNRIPLKPALGSVCSLANYSAAHEETHSSRVFDFRNIVCSLFPKAIPFYFYFTFNNNFDLIRTTYITI